MIIFFFFEMAWMLYFQYINVFMFQRFHYDNSHLGLFMAWVALGFSFSFLYLIPKLAGRYNNASLFFISCILSAIFNLITVLVPSMALIWIVNFINSISNAVGYSTALGLFSDKMGAEHQGWIMGITAAIGSLALGATALLGGALNLANTDIILYTVVIANLIAALLCPYLKPAKQKMH